MYRLLFLPKNHFSGVQLLLLGMLLAILQSCNPTRYLPPNAQLLRSNRVKLRAAPDVKEKATLGDNLAALISPKPNSRFLGIPVQLYLYNLRYRKYQQDSTNYQLQSGTVQKPVIYDSAAVRSSVQNMHSFLFNAGFFHAEVRDTTSFRNRRANVTYEVNTGPVQRLDRVRFDVDDSVIRQVLLSDSMLTLLQPGAVFNMQLLEGERDRLTAHMRNSGYYRFSNENISFEIDTLHETTPLPPPDTAVRLSRKEDTAQEAGQTLSVRVVVRQGTEKEAYYLYQIGRIRVYPDYIGQRELRNPKMIDKWVDDMRIRYNNYWLKEDVIARNVFLDSGRLFSQQDYDKTITQLNELGVFQYVRIALNEDTTIKDGHVLRCSIYMNPTQRYDFNTSFEVSSASTYTAGTAVSFGIRNRNLFKSASQLSITATAGVNLIYDDNLGSTFFQKFYNQSRSIGVNANLSIPRFLAPFSFTRFSKSALPRTIFNLGTNLLDRADYFILTNTSASVGYRWRPVPNETWEATPLFVNVFRLSRVSPDFQERLDTNTFLQNSYRDVTIVGENIAYTYNNNEQRRGKNYTYMRLSAEEAGALLSGVSLISQDIRSRISTRAAQYVRLDADLRHYLSLRRKVLAMRFALGVGIPYGNNNSLPYAKQYFAGGAYSVRGWRVRTLGPGSYYVPDTTGRSIYVVDRTGDIRLETSAELRFDLFRLFSGGVKFSGATFADAGNVWLAHANANYPGGEFRFSHLYQDIAVSTGLGLRLNFGDFIILRVDGAMPIKKPYITQNGGWVFNQIRFSDAAWRAENLVLSFAIGYPF